MPSHRVASLTNLTQCVLPTLTSRWHCRCFCLFEKSTASVLVSSNRTALLSAHSRLAWAHRSNLLKRHVGWAGERVKTGR